MSMMFEIYTDLSKEQLMETDIDVLFQYPKGSISGKGKSLPNILTERYRRPFKHPTKDLWAAPVDDVLVDKCKDMTEAERDKYYLTVDLKDFQYLVDNGWFPDIEEI